MRLENENTLRDIVCLPSLIKSQGEWETPGKSNGKSNCRECVEMRKKILNYSFLCSDSSRSCSKPWCFLVLQSYAQQGFK